jgi:hypothetical protein
MSATHLRFITIFAFALFSPVPSALGQASLSPADQWTYYDGKIGIASEGSFHPHFFFAQCDRAQRRATATIEIDPKLLGDAVTHGEYIVLRINGNANNDMMIEHLSFGEDGTYAWTITVPFGQSEFDLLYHTPRLKFMIATGPSLKDVKEKATYEVPETKRQASMKSFIQDCFLAQAAPRPNSSPVGQ